MTGGQRLLSKEHTLVQDGLRWEAEAETRVSADVSKEAQVGSETIQTTTDIRLKTQQSPTRPRPKVEKYKYRTSQTRQYHRHIRP